MGQVNASKMRIVAAVLGYVAATTLTFGFSLAKADHCGDGCAKIEHNLPVTRDSENKIKVEATIARALSLRKKWHGYASVSFYILNLGPEAITNVSVSPDYYLGWGCTNWFTMLGGNECNLLEDKGRIEAGSRSRIDVFYDFEEKDRDHEIHDLLIRDSNRVVMSRLWNLYGLLPFTSSQKETSYGVRIKREGPIPTYVVRTSADSRQNCRGVTPSVSVGTTATQKRPRPLTTVPETDDSWFTGEIKGNARAGITLASSSDSWKRMVGYMAYP